MTILMLLVSFLKLHWLDLLLVLLFIGFLAWLWKRGKQEAVRRIIYALVSKAEQQYGSKTGPIKWADVWAGIYEKLPWVVRLAFTKEELEAIIEDGVKWLKKQLESKPGANLLPYAEEMKLLEAPSIEEPTDP